VGVRSPRGELKVSMVRVKWYSLVWLEAHWLKSRGHDSQTLIDKIRNKSEDYPYLILF
jgi:hypothetical protein